MTPFEYGTCSGCGEQHALTHYGEMRAHRLHGELCAGTGKPSGEASDEQSKDYLRGANAAAQSWAKPYGSRPATRYMIPCFIKGVFQRLEFFTYAGASAYLRNELKGKGEIVAYLLLIATILIAGCSTVPQNVHHTSKTKMRVTLYNKFEDRYHDRVACSSKTRAKEGVTVAADSSVPCGTQVFIPALAGRVGDGYFTVQDRGSAVEKRKASHGLLPIIDVFVSRKKYRRLVSELEQVMEVIFL